MDTNHRVESLDGQGTREEALRRAGQLEAALEEAREHLLRYRELFEFAPDGYLVTDAAGVIAEANHAATVLFCIPGEFLRGKPLPFLLAAEDRDAFYTRLSRLHTHGEAVRDWKVRLLRRKAAPLDAAVTATVISDREGRPTGMRWLVRDVSALEEARRRAVGLERLAAIGEMAAGLAHESRNALQRSLACLEMLRWRLAGQPEALDLVARTLRAQDDLLRLYEDVRAYAAPVRLDPRPCDVAAVWREAWAQVVAACPQRDARLDEETAGADLGCAADPFRLGQVFRNLFENSLAACPGPVRLRVACAAAADAGFSALRVAVTDNGPGLNAEQRQRLFEPFYTTKVKGTGLGMAIAKRIVEAHGGQIAVSDVAGRGATIVLTLPRKPA
jgi:two-component system, LuxR family, sensor kinase FixL